MFMLSLLDYLDYFSLPYYQVSRSSVSVGHGRGGGGGRAGAGGPGGLSGARGRSRPLPPPVVPPSTSGLSHGTPERNRLECCFWSDFF